MTLLVLTSSSSTRLVVSYRTSSLYFHVVQIRQNVLLFAAEGRAQTLGVPRKPYSALKALLIIEEYVSFVLWFVMGVMGLMI